MSGSVEAYSLQIQYPGTVVHIKKCGKFKVFIFTLIISNQLPHFN